MSSFLMNPSNNPYYKIESEKDIKAKNLEVILKIKFDEEKDEIYRIYEISDNRIAVELEKCLKIYSLKTFILLTEINHDNIDNSIELKNKDIAICDYSVVSFYKFTENIYIYYQKIKDEKIFEIYELKNENLILCISHGLNIYSKDKGEYKFLIKMELNETVGNILEIKNNIIIVFLFSRSGTWATADYSPYDLNLLNMETKKGINLSGGTFSRYDDKHIFYGCNFIIKKNKYLLARYAGCFDIYDISNIENDNLKSVKRIYKIKFGINFFPIMFETLCDYDDDNFIILPSKEIYKYDEKSNKIILLKHNKIEMKLIDMIKLKNNKYVAHSKNELFIFKK